MADDLTQLETWLEPLMAALSNAERRKLAIEIARDLRTLQAANIRAQRGPDGVKWEGRKNTREPNQPIRWLYKARDGHVRELEMSSWRNEGGGVIGYDKEAGGIRTMLHSGMLKKLSPQHGSAPTAAQRRRAKLMMMGLLRKLQSRVQGNEAVVQFGGGADRVADRVARVHHFGLRDHVKPGGPEYDYPERPLLGITDAFKDRLRDKLVDLLAKG